MSEIRKGIIKVFNSSNWTADVQLVGGVGRWLENIPITGGIPSADLVAGNTVAILLFDPNNPNDACVLAVMRGGGSGGSALGAWAAKNVDTVYQAASDGFVVAWYDKVGTYSVTLRVKTDGNNPPTTVRTAGGTDVAINYDLGVCCPVRSGDYYEVEMARSGGAGTTYVYWIPLIS